MKGVANMFYCICMTADVCYMATTNNLKLNDLFIRRTEDFWQRAVYFWKEFIYTVSACVIRRYWLWIGFPKRITELSITSRLSKFCIKRCTEDNTVRMCCNPSGCANQKGFKTHQYNGSIIATMVMDSSRLRGTLKSLMTLRRPHAGLKKITSLSIHWL